VRRSLDNYLAEKWRNHSRCFLKPKYLLDLKILSEGIFMIEEGRQVSHGYKQLI
jgi:hypothetical protein